MNAICANYCAIILNLLFKNDHHGSREDQNRSHDFNNSFWNDQLLGPWIPVWPLTFLEHVTESNNDEGDFRKQLIIFSQVSFTVELSLKSNHRPPF